MRLQALGIATPLQLRDANPRWIRERFNVVLERTVLELQGVPCIELEHGRPDNKTIAATRSFGRPVTERRELEESLSFHASRAAEKARKQGVAACSIMVLITTNHHDPKATQYYNQQIVQLSTASADTPRLVRAAHARSGRDMRPGHAYKKAGVIIAELVKADQMQRDLLSNACMATGGEDLGGM